MSKRVTDNVNAEVTSEVFGDARLVPFLVDSELTVATGHHFARSGMRWKRESDPAVPLCVSLDT